MTKPIEFVQSEQGLNDEKKLIEGVFQDNIFNIFREYCKENQLTTMDDLYGFDFSQLTGCKGLGKGKIDKIITIYNDYFGQTNEIPEYIIKIIQNFSVEEVYADLSFRHFRDYCQEHHIQNMTQLIDFDFSLIGMVEETNVIVERLRLFLSKFEIENSTKQLQKEQAKEEQSQERWTINPYFCDKKIIYLRSLDVSNSIIKYFTNQSITEIGQIKATHMNEKIPSVGSASIEKFTTCMEWLAGSVFDLFKELYVKIKKEPEYRFFYQKAQGKTLQEIGDLAGLTRERVRQLTVKAEGFYQDFFGLFSDYLISEYLEGVAFGDDELSEIFIEHEDLVVAKFALMNGVSERICYLEEMERFFVDQDVEYIRNAIRLLVDELPQVFKLDEYVLQIESLRLKYGLGFLSFEDFYAYFIGTGFRKYHKFICKRSLDLGNLYQFIVKEYFPDGIRVYDETVLDKVKQIMIEDFGYDEVPDYRAMEMRIAAVAVLCDRGTYISPDYINVPHELLVTIKDYIDNCQAGSLLMADVFHRFEVELKQKSNITNRYFLHGVLKYYYEEELNFTRDMVSKSEIEGKKFYQLFEEFLHAQDGPVTREQIKATFPGASDVMIANACDILPTVSYWDYNCFIHTSKLNVSNSEKQVLRMLLSQFLLEGGGYTNAHRMYREIEQPLDGFLKRNQITNSVNLFYVLMSLFNDAFYFRRPHILDHQPVGQFTTLELVKLYVADKDKFSLTDVSGYLSKLGLTESTAYGALNDLRDQLIQISGEEFVHKKRLKIDNLCLEECRKIMESLLKGNEYLALRAITDYKVFPEIGYEWNVFVLDSIINHYFNEYRLISKEFKDKRYVCSIVVKESSVLNTFEDVVVYNLKYQFPSDVEMTTNNVRNFLVKKGIILKNLPKDVWDSERIMINENGKVSIYET